MNAYLDLFQKKKHPLIMSMPVNDARLVSAAYKAGADAVKLHVNVHHHASDNRFDDVGAQAEFFDEIFANRQGPLGIMPGGSTAIVQNTYNDTFAYPFDFLSLYVHHTPPSILSVNAARMIACNSENSLNEIALFEKIGADILEASIVPGDEYGMPLQMLDLIHYRQLCCASSLPVVVPTQRSIKPSELSSLFDTGVRGIMIGAIVTGDTEKTVLSSIAAFRNAIDKL